MDLEARLAGEKLTLKEAEQRARTVLDDDLYRTLREYHLAHDVLYLLPALRSERERAAFLERERDEYVAANATYKHQERELRFERERAEKLREALALAVEIIEDCWGQFAYTAGDGRRITGGLSALELVEANLPTLHTALSEAAPVLDESVLAHLPRSSLEALYIAALGRLAEAAPAEEET